MSQSDNVPNTETAKPKMPMEVSWDFFRNTGAFWFANRFLHLFGLVLVADVKTSEDGAETVQRVYPARTRFRGFDEASEANGFKRLSKYMNVMGGVLVEEAMDDGPPVQPRIHVADLDPDTLVGIALCEDGAGGWVVMQQTPDDEVAHAVGDELGEIVLRGHP